MVRINYEKLKLAVSDPSNEWTKFTTFDAFCCKNFLGSNKYFLYSIPSFFQVKYKYGSKNFVIAEYKGRKARKLYNIILSTLDRFKADFNRLLSYKNDLRNRYQGVTPQCIIIGEYHAHETAESDIIKTFSLVRRVE